ncbi:MAG TPA: hypothetical protein VLI39_18075 [Sedimentisphaerales bacterium]|nr:hypothetical protein [Sedimentisphaerales bacterium]
MVSAGAHTISRITGLGGWGGSARATATTHIAASNALPATECFD